MPRIEYLDWNVPYAPGRIEREGLQWQEICGGNKSRNAPAHRPAIQLHPDRTTITADGQDVSILMFPWWTRKGEWCRTQNNLIRFELKGAGKIIGVGNGDPSSHEPDKASQRRVFNGFAQVIVQADRQRGNNRVDRQFVRLEFAAL